jgi:hypothetical protein
MLNTSFLLGARLRISGAIPPLTPMPSRYTRGQPYLYFERQQLTLITGKITLIMECFDSGTEPKHSGTQATYTYII